MVADFGERVYGFTRDDVTLKGTLKARVTGFSGSNGSTTYTITITPEAKDPNDDSPRYIGSVNCHVAASVTEDAAGNPNTADERYLLVNFPAPDTQKPYPTITAPTTTQEGAFEVTVEFSEPVRGFSSSDVDLGWGPASSFNPNNRPESRLTIADWTAHPGRTRYTFTVRSSSMLDGTVYIAVDENVATDSARNGNYRAVNKRVRVNPLVQQTPRGLL